MCELDKKAVVLKRKTLSTDLKISCGYGSIELHITILQNGYDAAIGLDPDVKRVAHFEFIYTPDEHISFRKIQSCIRKAVDNRMDL